MEETPRYLIRDGDAIYGEVFHRQARALRIKQTPTAPQSPWQNPYAERVIGSIRRQCLDCTIIPSASVGSITNTSGWPRERLSDN